MKNEPCNSLALKSLFLLMMGVFLVSCSHKVDISEAKENELIAYTSKFEDTTNGFLLVGTYLNPIKNGIKYKDKEVFLISIYPKNSLIDYDTLMINMDKNVEIQELEDNDPLISLATVKLPWARYLRVSVPTKNSDKLTLSFDHIVQINGTSHQFPVEISFQKIAKSLYWNPK